MNQQLQNLESLSDTDIDVGFLEQIASFCKYINTNGPVKAIETGETLTGSGQSH